MGGIRICISAALLRSFKDLRFCVLMLEVCV